MSALYKYLYNLHLQLQANIIDTAKQFNIQLHDLKRNITHSFVDLFVYVNARTSRDRGRCKKNIVSRKVVKGTGWLAQNRGTGRKW